MNFSIVRLAVALAALLPLAAMAQDPKVTLRLSTTATVTGTVATNARGEKVNMFRGIRYAEAALGANRFKPTKAIKPTGAINATAFGNMCWTDSRYDNPPQYPNSEDCLFMNIYTPAGVTSWSNLPVMVWTHGGAWTSGNGNYYDGRNLVGSAGNKVVYVSFNYRLGLFGFLANQQLLKEGNGANAAMRDMELAHQWVRDNIRAFGGNPHDITAFGESAGAFMIALQLITNGGKQTIFDRAILESGGYPAYSQVATYAEQDAYIATVANGVGCANADAAKVLACLRATDAAKLMAVGGNLDWRPVVDNKFLTALPSKLVAEGKVSKIPTILGTNADEGYLYAYGVQTDEAFDQFATFGFGLTPEEAAEALALYPASDFSRAQFRAAELIADLIFVCPSEKVTDVLSRTSAPTYHYRFNETVEFGDVQPLSIHTAEMRFVFNDSSVPADAGSLKLAANIGKFWTNFATHCSPNGATDGASPVWPRYTTTGKQEIVLQKQLGKQTNGVKPARHAARCAFWNKVEARKAEDVLYKPVA